MFNGTSAKRQTVFVKEDELYIKHKFYTLVIDDCFDFILEDNRDPDRVISITLSNDEVKAVIEYLQKYLEN